MTRQPTILWHGNAPWTPQGYGNQARVFEPLLHDAGWNIFHSANYGLAGAPLNTPFATVLPRGLDEWGNDILPLHFKHLMPDVMFLLCDSWVLAPEMLQQIPAAVWAPIDHDEMPPAVASHLQFVRWPIAMSKHGERAMRKGGLDPFYIPHGINTEVFKPGDRARARKAWVVPEDAFFAVMVGANKGNPSRKSIDRVMKAWAKFSAHRDNVVLYLHTMHTDHYGGYNLAQIAKEYAIDPNKLRFPATYPLLQGKYDWTAMSDLYNAADVLLAPSMGEGFGIPVIEAQGCGTPVVVADTTAQTELCGAGHIVPVDAFDDLSWTFQEQEQANIRPSAILRGIEWAYDQRGNDELRKQARDFAMQYDADRIFERHMKPAMEYMAEVNRVEHAELYAEFENQHAAVEPPEAVQEAAR